jgi:uncharacterized membrane protein
MINKDQSKCEAVCKGTQVAGLELKRFTRTFTGTGGCMSTFRDELIFSLIIAGICIVLAFLDLGHIPAAPSGLHSRGLISAVDNSQVRTNLIVKTNIQHLTVRLLDGPYKGQEVPVVNMLTGKMELDEFYEAGKTILVEYDAPDGKPVHALARGYYRLRLEFVLIGLFAVLLVAVA